MCGEPKGAVPGWPVSFEFLWWTLPSGPLVVLVVLREFSMSCTDSCTSVEGIVKWV